MAYHGELVRMENGRWARFQECVIYRDGSTEASQLPLLVAVELDERIQELLNSSEKMRALYAEDEVGPVRMDFRGGAQDSFELKMGLDGRD